MKHKLLSLISVCLLTGMGAQAQILIKRVDSPTRSPYSFPNMYFSQDGDKDAWSYSTSEGSSYSSRTDISAIDYIATQAYLENNQTLEDWTAPTYDDCYVNSIDNSWNGRATWNLANVHDPSVCLASDGYYYMVATDASYGNVHTQSGGHFICRRSKNLIDWEVMGPTMKSLPEWIKPKLNEIRAAMGLGESTVDWENGDFGYWAPCIRKVNDNLYRMYYCVTIPGTIDGDGTWSERAFIGLMETSDPSDCESWVDKGYVTTNYSDRDLDFRHSNTDYDNCYFKYNAIDPTYIITEDGEHWLIYGSWHSGFAAVQLNPETGKTLLEQGNPWGSENEAAYGKRVFTRNYNNRWQGSEAPEVVYHDGYYYLFMAFDALAVPYNTHVVRSKNIDGPYEDITGTKFTDGTTQGNVYPVMTHPYKFGDDHGWVGISHCAVFDDGQGNWYYASQQRFPADWPDVNASNFIMLGGIRRIVWTESGWPLVLPERYANVPQELISESELIGNWQNIDLSYQYGVQKPSENMTLNADHTITGGTFDGQTWSFDAGTGILRIGDVAILYLSRECDWEANPRKATIVYAGLSANNCTTYWGKKVD